MLATPMGAADVAWGEIGWAVLRGGIYSTGFLLVMVAMGLVSSWWAVLVLPAALLTGFAFAAVGMGLTTYMRSWQDFEFIQLALMPMFLFSATFFPVTTYHGPVRWIGRGDTALPQRRPGPRAVHRPPDLCLGRLGRLPPVMGLAGMAVIRRRLERLLLS